MYENELKILGKIIEQKKEEIEAIENDLEDAHWFTCFLDELSQPEDKEELIGRMETLRRQSPNSQIKGLATQVLMKLRGEIK